MIIVKSEREIELMRRAGKITAAARALAGEMVKPGVTTREIDKAVFHFIRSQGAQPSFLNYNGYPASVCVSVNDEIIHGIPGPRVLKEGDIVSVDVGAYIGGFHGDCAATYACGKISDEAQRLIDVTRQSFLRGSRRPARATASPISPTPCRRMWRRTAFPLCGSMLAMASAEICTRRPRSPILGAGSRTEAAARHDDCCRTDGERRRRSHPPDERWLDRSDPGREIRGALREHHPHH